MNPIPAASRLAIAPRDAGDAGAAISPPATCHYPAARRDVAGDFLGAEGRTMTDTEARIEMAAALSAEGLSLREIGARMGLGQSGAYHYVLKARAAGDPRAAKKTPKERGALNLRVKTKSPDDPYIVEMRARDARDRRVGLMLARYFEMRPHVSISDMAFSVGVNVGKLRACAKVAGVELPPHQPRVKPQLSCMGCGKMRDSDGPHDRFHTECRASVAFNAEPVFVARISIGGRRA